MAITANFMTRVVTSTASITDVVAFHLALRDIEDDPLAMVYPVIHTYKEIDLGSGAKFPAVAFINGWTLQFNAGNWEMRGGNVSATINPVANCYVKYTASAAYSVTAVGAGGASASDIADAVLAAMNLTPPGVDARKMNGAVIIGDGSETDKWRGVSVPA